MDKDFTLIIITHNRQYYLPRIFEYYRDFKYPIVIADSSNKPFTKSAIPSNFTYFYFPQKTLIEKLAETLNEINTKFVAINGEDDFITPSGISLCVDFLLKNSEYSSAKGNCYYYWKDSVNKKRVKYFTIYGDRTSYKNDSDIIFERIENYFNPYCSLYTACHYTSNLGNSFNAAARGGITNLFLNEYLTGIFPLAVGKHAELPFLYQLRENTNFSDGNIALNLDRLLAENANVEFEQFININAELISKLTTIDYNLCKDKLTQILNRYAKQLSAQKFQSTKSFKSKLMMTIKMVPIFGKQILQYFYKKKLEKIFVRLIVTEDDKRQLLKIESLILKYANVLK